MVSEKYTTNFDQVLPSKIKNHIPVERRGTTRFPIFFINFDTGMTSTLVPQVAKFARTVYWPLYAPKQSGFEINKFDNGGV